VDLAAAGLVGKPQFDSLTGEKRLYWGESRGSGAHPGRGSANEFGWSAGGGGASRPML
jgi:hypothetical protein